MRVPEVLITGDQQLLKQINRMALVRQICAKPALSRADLADTLGLTKSTVSLLVRELMDEGWLTEHELVTTGSLGRRPTPLHINPQRLVLLGAEVGVGNTRVVATSLTGQVLASIVVDYAGAVDPQLCLQAVAKAFSKIAKLEPISDREICGLGVGLPGGVDEAQGVLHFAPNLGWRNVNVAGQLRKYLKGTRLENTPLFIQNEADAAALAEFEFTDQVSTDPLVYVSIGYGVGAGVVVNDRLLTGYRGFAGEIGHTILQANGPACSCGRLGCAEAFIGLKALLREAGCGPNAKQMLTLVELRTRVKAREPAAVQSAEKAGRYLGVLLQNLWVAFDPMRIVLGGAALELGDAFLQPALQTLGGYASAAQLTPPVVTISRFGENAVAVGAAALVRYRITRPFA